MSIRSIESVGDQRHIKQINNNHSAANKVRKVSAVSIRLGGGYGMCEPSSASFRHLNVTPLLALPPFTPPPFPSAPPQPPILHTCESKLCEAVVRLIDPDSTRAVARDRERKFGPRIHRRIPFPRILAGDLQESLGVL